MRCHGLAAGPTFLRGGRSNVEMKEQIGRTVLQGKDSQNRPVKAGDQVTFRGGVFTVDHFRPGEGRYGCRSVVFVEPVEHTTEVPDEISIDLVGQ